MTTNSGQKVYNPFDKVSVHQLNGPVFSPGVFNTVTGSAEKVRETCLFLKRKLGAGKLLNIHEIQ